MIYKWWTLDFGFDDTLEERWLKLGPFTFCTYMAWKTRVWEIHFLNRLVSCW
jgi:hypothetical protein